MAKHECFECEWMKTLVDSEGDSIEICVCCHSPCYLEQTGICGWCEYEEYGDCEDDDEG